MKKLLFHGTSSLLILGLILTGCGSSHQENLTIDSSKTVSIESSPETINDTEITEKNTYNRNLETVVSNEEVDATGESAKVATKAKYDFDYGFFEGLAAVSYNNKLGVIDEDGYWVVEPKYISAVEKSFRFSEGLLGVAVNDGSENYKWGFIDREGKMIIKPQYEWIHDFSEGKAAVTTDNGLGFIDKNGNMVIRPQSQFNDAGGALLVLFQEGLAAVNFESGVGFIDEKGKMVIKPIEGVVIEGTTEIRFSKGIAELNIQNDTGYRKVYINNKGMIVQTKEDYLEGLQYIQELEEHMYDSPEADHLYKPYEAWDIELNKIYKLLMKKLPASKQKALKKEEREWIKTRDSHQNELKEEGLDGVLTIQEVLIRDTKERTLQLIDQYFAK
ncbi:WG repeat-containing protein [Paenibacillus sp. FSL H8-0317]|uniref:WG repeat-containing protein n=1 Tax=unclassified Paenibacillus TaxID=185978 RepID=UPI0030CD9FDA